MPSEVTVISIPHYRQKINRPKPILTYIFADNGSFDFTPAFSHTTFGAVRHNRCFSRTAKSVIFGAKNRSVLSKILIGFFENPLEIGGDFRTRIFTAFSMRTGQKALKTRHFRGSFICHYLPSNSAKFGFGNLTRSLGSGRAISKLSASTHRPALSIASITSFMISAGK